MTVQLYPEIILEGDLSPDMGAEVDDICVEIEAACKGWGTDEARLLKAMGSMSPETRCLVPMQYKATFGKGLRSVMKSECGSRDFGTALQLLAVPPNEADCDLIDLACEGVGENKELLSTIIVGRSNKEMEVLRKTYFNLHTKDLGQKLDKELGGDYENLIFNCLQGTEETFDAEFHTPEKVKEDSEALYKMGQGKWGTNEKGLFKLICMAPKEHLENVNSVYTEEYGYTLLKVMEKEMGGEVGRATVFMLGLKLKPYETVAKKLHDAMKGFGTNELLLTSLLIRYQPIMKHVKVAFMEEYGKPLEEAVKSETGGDYEKLLLEVIAKADEL